MQWILQDFEDNHKLGDALESLGISYSFHKVVPFIGKLSPEPVITDDNVVLFGSYSLRHYAEKHGLTPGVFSIRPYLFELGWQGFLLNDDAECYHLNTCLGYLDFNKSSLFFVRPVADSKEIAGAVMDSAEIEYTVNCAMNLKPNEIIKGSLNPDTLMMFSTPKTIYKEWRIWVVNDEIVTYSLYKEGRRVIYRNEIDSGALTFANEMIIHNLGYSRAYVLDVCLTDDGYKIVETNCINAAGFYAADLQKLVDSINRL